MMTEVAPLARTKRRRVLIAVGGAEAARAVHVGFDVAQRMDDDVALVHVISPLEAYVPGIGIGVDSVDRCQNEALALLNRVAEGEPCARHTRCFVGFGSRPEEIMRTATLWGADLVVVGARAKRGFWRTLTRSVADHIARAAPVSVLVVREAA